MTANAASQQPTPEQRHEERMRDMEREYKLIYENLYKLNTVIPVMWLEERLPYDDNLMDYAITMQSINTALTMYIESLQQDPDKLPDARGGDLRELKACFRELHSDIRNLEKLLPTDELPDGFVRNLLKAAGDDKRRNLLEATDQDGSVAMKEKPEEDKPKDKPKKKARNSSQVYQLPGEYEDRLRTVISALKLYAEYAAPLVGATFQKMRMTDDKRPDETVVNFPECSITKKSLNPLDYGVSEKWVKALNLTVNLTEDLPLQAL